MMMKFTAALTSAVIALGTAACQSQANTNNVSANTAVQSSANSNANVVSSFPSPSADNNDIHSTGSLATPIEAYKTAYDVRKRKDVEGLKKVMSKDMLDFITEMGKSADKSLEDMLKEMCDEPQAPSAEARSEKIVGDRATIEYLDVKGGWSAMDLQKFGSEWKLTFPKPDKNMANSPKKP